MHKQYLYLKRPSINYVVSKERGGPAKCYHAIFIFLKLIKILTESVTWGRGVQKWPILAWHNLWTAPYLLLNLNTPPFCILYLQNIPCTSHLQANVDGGQCCLSVVHWPNIQEFWRYWKRRWERDRERERDRDKDRNKDTRWKIKRPCLALA